MRNVDVASCSGNFSGSSWVCGSSLGLLLQGWLSSCKYLWHGQFSVWVATLRLRRTFWNKLDGQPWLGGVAVTSCSFCGKFWMVMGLRLFEKTCQLLSMSGLTKVSGVKPWKCPCAARREGASLSCHLALLCGTSFQTLSPSALLLARFLLPLILSTMLTSTRLVLHNLMM